MNTHRRVAEKPSVLHMQYSIPGTQHNKTRRPKSHHSAAYPGV